MPKPGDLRMYVQSEPYEVECDEDHTHMFREHFVSGCSKCGTTTHVAGSRTVRLRGWVDCFKFTPWRNSNTFYREIDLIGMSSVLAKTVSAHRAGTLPAELYKSDDNPDGLEAPDA